MAWELIDGELVPYWRSVDDRESLQDAGRLLPYVGDADEERSR